MSLRCECLGKLWKGSMSSGENSQVPLEKVIVLEGVRDVALGTEKVSEVEYKVTRGSQV
jgi:hypothetical protein